MRREFFSFITDRGRFLFGAKANKRRLESQRVRATQNINNNNTLTAAKQQQFKTVNRWAKSNDCQRIVVAKPTRGTCHRCNRCEFMSGGHNEIISVFMDFRYKKLQPNSQRKNALAYTTRVHYVGMLKWWGWGLSYVYYIHIYILSYIYSGK